MRRALMIYSGPSEGTSAILFKELGKVASEQIEVKFAPNTLIKGGILQKLLYNISDNIRRIPLIVWSDGIILHSYSALSMISIIIARLLRRKVIVVNWDVYPTTIAGRRRPGVLRKLADYLERLAIKLSTRIVIPSEDFRNFVVHPQITVVPLWPSAKPMATVERPKDGPIKIAFVGQIDVTRGLSQAVQAIGENSAHRLEFYIFSSDARLEHNPTLEIENCSLTYYPHLPRDQVLDQIRHMHFGLISLHQDLDQPGYPSKTFDYLAANVPILYFGRPLEHFCNSLEAFNVGRVYQPGDDLREIYDKIMAGWASNRNAFLEYTSMNKEKITSITA
jgi:hypothetical protein